MSTQLLYPENVIWYVEARHSGGSRPTSGSAVAIRLQSVDSSVPAKTYLITCTHVLRRPAPNGSLGFGILSSEIRAWAPSTAYTEGQAKSVSICSGIKPLDSAEVPVNKRTNVADDWVVLEFQDDELHDYADSVKQWAHSDSREQDYTIIGYPGGMGAFSRSGVVRPTKITGRLQFREEANGVFTLQGDATRAGTSGGGIFDSQTDAFAGIHRSRIDSTVQVQAISTRKIREILRERGYEPLSNGEEIDVKMLANTIVTNVLLPFSRRHNAQTEQTSEDRTSDIWNEINNTFRATGDAKILQDFQEYPNLAKDLLMAKLIKILEQDGSLAKKMKQMLEDPRVKQFVEITRKSQGEEIEQTAPKDASAIQRANITDNSVAKNIRQRIE